jgi:hypothetical protein
MVLVTTLITPPLLRALFSRGHALAPQPEPEMSKEEIS